MSTVVSPHEAMVSRLAALPKPVLWAMAARLKTLGLSLVPVAAGSWLAAIEGSGWRADVMLAAMLSAALIQIGTNLWNDAADAASGVDGPERLGPPRLTALGLLDGEQVRRMALGSFIVAAMLGLWLTLIGGWVVIGIGLISLALGYFYSMGPRPLSGTPLGEMLVIGFFGIIAVAGTAYLHDAPVGIRVVLLGGIIGLPAAAVLLLNNHRDRATDARAGRRTLAIVVGETASKALFALFLGTAYLGALGFAAQGLATIAFVPVAILGCVLIFAMMRLPVSAALNQLIPLTALYQAALLMAMVLNTL